MEKKTASYWLFGGWGCWCSWERRFCWCSSGRPSTARPGMCASCRWCIGPPSTEKGCLPLDAVLDRGKGSPLHYVQQEEGLGGSATCCGVPSYNFQELEDGTLFFFMMDSLEDPLVLSASVPLEVLYDGMEVRLE